MVFYFRSSTIARVFKQIIKKLKEYYESMKLNIFFSESWLMNVTIKMVTFISGLLGNFNDNPADDFTAPNGSVTNSTSNEEAIYNYGKVCKC